MRRAVAVLAVFAGAFAIGRSGERPAPPTRIESVWPGAERAGTRLGQRLGYAAGRRQGAAGDVRAAYVHAYRAAFRDAGLTPPSVKSIGP
jgi:hypothetical protein